MQAAERASRFIMTTITTIYCIIGTIFPFRLSYFFFYITGRVLRYALVLTAFVSESPCGGFLPGSRYHPHVFNIPSSSIIFRVDLLFSSASERVGCESRHTTFSSNSPSNRIERHFTNYQRPYAGLGSGKCKMEILISCRHEDDRKSVMCSHYIRHMHFIVNCSANSCVWRIASANDRLQCCIVHWRRLHVMAPLHKRWNERRKQNDNLNIR